MNLTSKFTKDYLISCLTRAIRTFAQTAAGMFTVGMAMTEIDWRHVLSVSLVSAVYSIVTSLAVTIPEGNSLGTLNIDTSQAEKDRVRLDLNGDPVRLKRARTVTLKVNPNADLSA